METPSPHLLGSSGRADLAFCFELGMIPLGSRFRVCAVRVISDFLEGLAPIGGI